MGSFSGILVVGPPHDPLGKTHFLARKNPNVWGDCPANQLASPSPRPHYSARPIRFEDTQAKCIDRESLATRRTGTKQGRSLYQPEKTADITRSRPPLVSSEIPVVASRNVGCLFFFRVVLQHLEIWLPTRKLSPKNEAFPHLTELRFTVNQVFFLSVQH